MKTEIAVEAGFDPLYRYFLIGAAVFFFAVWAIYLLTLKLPFDGLGDVAGRDFVNTWMSAKLALTGHPQSYFGFAHYNQALRQTIDAKLFLRNWSYPPNLLLFIWPLGFLPYLAAFAVWALAGAVLYLWSGLRATRHGIWLLALAPAAMVNLMAGQNGFFTAALLIAALKNWDGRPVLSGVLFGMLSIKPQLVLLVPVALIVSGRWRCLMAAGATVLALGVITGLVFGFDAWVAYFKIAAPVQNAVLMHGHNLMMEMMPTPFMNARMLGLSLPEAWTVQGFVSMFALAAVVWTFWKPRDPMLSYTLLLTASLVFTPYVFNYDMIALTIALSQLRERPDADRMDTKFVLTVWVLPVAMMIVGLFGNITGSALILLAFGNHLLKRMRSQDVSQETGRALTALQQPA